MSISIVIALVTGTRLVSVFIRTSGIGVSEGVDGSLDCMFSVSNIGDKCPEAGMANGCAIGRVWSIPIMLALGDGRTASREKEERVSIDLCASLTRVGGVGEHSSTSISPRVGV